MNEDEIKAWFFKYGQYANGRDMALIKAIEAAIKPQRTWVGLTDEEQMQIWDGIVKYAPSEIRIKDFARAVATKLKEKNT